MKLSEARSIVQRLYQCRDAFGPDSDQILDRQTALYQAATRASRPGATRQDRQNLAYTMEETLPVPLGPEAARTVEGLYRG